jgi:hypothetical protein
LKFIPTNFERIDELILDMQDRANKFSGISDADKEHYIELATRFPKILEPPKGLQPCTGDVIALQIYIMSTTGE